MAKKDHSTSQDENKLMSNHEYEERVGDGSSVSEGPESEDGVNFQAKMIISNRRKLSNL
jgi:hypothetical protein